MKKKVVILMHEKDRHRDISCYQIWWLAKIWRDDGLEVDFLFGVKKFIPADILFMHIDLSIVPEEYFIFADQYPVVINGRIKDIRKSSVAMEIIKPNEDYDGPVIVKTNLNYQGKPEARLAVDHLPKWPERPRKLLRRWLMRRTGYTIFKSKSEVPPFLANDRRLVIQKFLPEREGDKYAMRLFLFLGHQLSGVRFISRDPIIKSHTDWVSERVEPHPDLIKLRNKMGLDYGKIDYVVHDDKPTVLDVNKTTGARNRNYTADYRERLMNRAKGIYDYFDEPILSINAPVIHQRKSIQVARTINRVVNKVSGIVSNEMKQKKLYEQYLLEFGKSRSDIWINSYSKSGTTWMQMILYQLTTDGEMDFDHIFDVSPWVWYSSLRNIKPSITPSPRLLKSHDKPELLEKFTSGKYIYMLRDGRDVALSWFYHRNNYRKFKGTFEEHFDDFLYGKDYNWFDHVKCWLENKPGLPLHYVKFEDLIRDFDETIKDLINFLGLSIDEQTLTRTRQQTTFEFLKNYDNQLGPQMNHFQESNCTPFSITSEGQFLRNGKVGEGKSFLSEAQHLAYQKRFAEILGDFDQVSEYR